jgi:dTDP-4-dehydrorhamnose reductase
MVNVLLIGSAGQIGAELLTVLQCHPFRVTAADRRALDLADAEALVSYVEALHPDILINAAAYTAVDKAESERDLAFAVNATAPGVMAQCMHRLGGLVVHYSTDYIFDGHKSSPYVEDDPPAPLNVYGASKLAGERAVVESGATHLIFRTCWIYDLRGRNFLNTMRRLAAERPELRVVADQFGAPTWSRWVARATAQVLAKCFESAGSRERLRAQWSGVYHMTAGGRTSWHGFASEIVEALAQKGLAPRIPVVPIGAGDYPTPAARPANSVLSNEKLKRAFGVEQVDWRAQLRECLEDLGQ